jgi:hypothetical protein
VAMVTTLLIVVSLLGAPLRSSLPRYTRSSGVKTLPFGASDGGATRAAPLLET